MRYSVTVAGRTFLVELAGSTVTVDGQTMHAELREVPGTNVKHLLLDGRSHRFVAQANEARTGWDVHLDGHRLDTEALDERTLAI
ncbi:MAG: hypothetical protein ACREMQ_18305, partial [Longimicrobiales bacterium]